MAKFWHSKSILYVKNDLNLSKKKFIKEYDFKGILFVVDIFWKLQFVDHFIFYNDVQFLMTFTQLKARLKSFLNGWLLVLGLKEGLVECATSCIKSEVMLLNILFGQEECFLNTNIHSKKGLNTSNFSNAYILTDWNPLACISVYIT